MQVVRQIGSPSYIGHNGPCRHIGVPQLDCSRHYMLLDLSACNDHSQIAESQASLNLKPAASLMSEGSCASQCSGQLDDQQSSSTTAHEDSVHGASIESFSKRTQAKLALMTEFSGLRGRVYHHLRQRELISRTHNHCASFCIMSSGDG